MDTINDQPVSIQIDLSYGNAAILKSREAIQEYVIGVCRAFEIERISDIAISPVDDEKSSFMMVQFADKTIITGFFNNIACTATIDVLTYKTINAKDLSEITKSFFDSVKVNHRSFVRS